MPPFYWLMPKDQRHNNWVLYSEDVGRTPAVRLRDRYADLACTRCHKLDEDLALDRGIAEDVRIRSRSDFVVTSEGFVAVSARLQDVLEQRSVSAVRFLALPDVRYRLMRPVRRVAVDRDTCGVDFLRPCPDCGRFRETCALPVRDSLRLSTEELLIAAPDCPLENVRGRREFFLASEAVVSVMKHAKVSGLEYHRLK